MTTVSERMRLDLALRGRSAATIDTYLRNARSFVDFHGRPPGRLGEPELRVWLAHLMETRHLSPDGMRPHIAALKFLYGVTLKRPERTDWIPWPSKPRHLPDILSKEEVIRLAEAAGTPCLRALILVGYGAGMRIGEATRLQPADIDAARGVLKVRGGKGDKDRLVSLSTVLLGELRGYYAAVRPPAPWLFPGTDPTRPIRIQTVQRAFRQTVARAGIAKSIHFHSLRHAYATHNLEDGVDLLTIQALLGHADFGTSQLYLQVRADHLRRAGSPLDRLPEPLR